MFATVFAHQLRRTTALHFLFPSPQMESVKAQASVKLLELAQVAQGQLMVRWRSA